MSNIYIYYIVYNSIILCKTISIFLSLDEKAGEVEGSGGKGNSYTDFRVLSI